MNFRHVAAALCAVIVSAAAATALPTPASADSCPAVAGSEEQSAPAKFFVDQAMREYRAVVQPVEQATVADPHRAKLVYGQIKACEGTWSRGAADGAFYKDTKRLVAAIAYELTIQSVAGSDTTGTEHPRFAIAQQDLNGHDVRFNGADGMTAREDVSKHLHENGIANPNWGQIFTFKHQGGEAHPKVYKIKAGAPNASENLDWNTGKLPDAYLRQALAIVYSGGEKWTYQSLPG